MMAPAGLSVEYNIGINNKFALLSTEVNESNKSNRKPKTIKKPDDKKSEVIVDDKKSEVNVKKPEVTSKVQQKVEKPKPKEQVMEVKKFENDYKKPVDNENKKQVKFNHERKNQNNFRREGNDSNRHVSNNKSREEQDGKVKNLNQNVRIQTIVVDATKPNIESMDLNTNINEDQNKENHKRSNFNRKQARLDKGKDVFDDRGKRVYDRHSGQVKSSVKGSNIKREHLNELDNNQNNDNKTNNEQNPDDQRHNKSSNDIKPTETEEVSKEISYAEYKKNLVLQGNVEITKIYSSETKAQTSNLNKNNDSNLSTDKAKKVQKVKKDTIDIEVDSSIKTAESYIVKNPRPNNKNFRPNNFKNKQFNDRQKSNKEKKTGTTVAPPSLNLTDEFPSL